MATALLTPVESSILEFINERLDNWKDILQAHISSFTELLELEKQTHATYQRIAASLSAAAPATFVASSDSTAESDGGDSGLIRRNAWLGPLQNYSLRFAADGNSYANFLTTSVLPQLQQLAMDQLKMRGRGIRSILTDAKSRLGKRHETVLAVMAAHERAWEIRARLLMTPVRCVEGQDESKVLSEAIAAGDPFTTEHELILASKHFLDEKRAFCTLLMEQLALVRLLETDLATGLRTIITESAIVKEQLLNKCLEALVECRSVTKDCEPLTEWKEALERNRLDWDWQVTAPPLDGFAASILTQINLNLATQFEDYDLSGPLVRKVSIRKSGYLMKSGGTFGTKWTVLFCVLVDSAALHCYSPEQLKKHSRCDMRIPSSSLHIHRKGLNELNTAAGRMFLGDDPDGGDLLSWLSPEYSISLLHPFTSVAPEGKHPDKHIFTISIPGDGSLFGRSERQFRLRSFVEEDMVDWCIAVKEVIGMGVVMATPEERSGSRPTSLVGSTPSTPRKIAPLAVNIPNNNDGDNNGDEDDNTRHPPHHQSEIHGGNYEEEVSQVAEQFSYMATASPTTPLEEENPWDS